MTRRDLFKILGAAPAVPLVSDPLGGYRIQPINRPSVTRRRHEQNYARIEFDVPWLIKQGEWKTVDKMLELEQNDVFQKIEPLGKILAEDGMQVYHAGWLDRDGAIWHRREDVDRYNAVYAIYSHPPQGEEQPSGDYNRARIVRGLFNIRLFMELDSIHTRLRSLHAR